MSRRPGGLLFHRCDGNTGPPVAGPTGPPLSAKTSQKTVKPTHPTADQAVFNPKRAELTTAEGLIQGDDP